MNNIIYSLFTYVVVIVVYRLVVCTYNIATLEPPQELLRDLILLHIRDAPDLYAFGLQEVSSKPHEVIQSSLSDDPWTEVISSCVCSKGYVMVSTGLELHSRGI